MNPSASPGSHESPTLSNPEPVRWVKERMQARVGALRQRPSWVPRF